MTIYNIMWYFFIYAFLGWCTEVSFFAVKTGKFVNRGFLNGPVCPVYGFGLVIIIMALTPLKENLLLLFLGSVVITSSLEFLTGWRLKRYFIQDGGIIPTTNSISAATSALAFR